MENPLLQIQLRIPFDQIRAEHAEPAIRALIDEAQARLDAISKEAAERNFENTLLALDISTERLDYALGIVKHLESVATTPELRAAYNAVQPAASAFYASIPLQQPLWRALQTYAETAEAQKLTGTRKRFLTKTLDTFRRHGAELDAAGKSHLKEIDVELAKLTTKYSENVLDATNGFELILTEQTKLAGLPPSAIAAARESAAAKGAEGWRFTLQGPSYIALMTYLDDPDIRRQVYQAYSTRCSGGGFDNRQSIRRILELRQERAALLGYRNFADLVLDDRMAHTGTQAEQFLRTLQEKTQAHFARENEALAAFGRSLRQEPEAPVKAWDVAYVAEKQRAALYDFDEEELRPYFPLESVVSGMFQIVGRLYGIQVTEETGMPVWDPQVRCYSVREESGGAHLGSFYADWFPRDNKRGGAWMDAFITGAPTAEGFGPHAGLICGNLTPPLEDRPSLLTHREVETIFHEFGHLLHHLLSRVEVRSLCGTSVAWDFVELPSQIMENWCWERAALDLFGRHYQTGEAIPEELFRKMKRARTFRGANGQTRQLGFGLVDLALHMHYSPEKDGDVIAYTRSFLRAFSPAELPPDHALIAAFTHLFGSPVGYGAGYYSYKWAEILDADAFTRFQAEGIFSRDAGSAFRETILARGDSEDPAVLYRSFMGRDPDVTALLARAGLTETTTTSAPPR